MLTLVRVALVLVSTILVTLSEARADAIWIGADQGVFQVDTTNGAILGTRLQPLPQQIGTTTISRVADLEAGPSGNLYLINLDFVNFQDYEVAKLPSAGAPSIIIPHAEAVTSETANTLLVADGTEIRRFDLGLGSFDPNPVLTLGPEVNNVEDLDIDAQGRILTVVELVANNADVLYVDGSPVGLPTGFGANDVAARPGGTILVSGQFGQDGALLEIDPSSGQTTTIFTLLGTGLSDVAVARTGGWFALDGNENLYENGNLVTLPFGLTDAHISVPEPSSLLVLVALVSVAVRRRAY